MSGFNSLFANPIISSGGLFSKMGLNQLGLSEQNMFNNFRGAQSSFLNNSAYTGYTSDKQASALAAVGLNPNDPAFGLSGGGYGSAPMGYGNMGQMSPYGGYGAMPGGYGNPMGGGYPNMGGGGNVNVFGMPGSMLGLNTGGGFLGASPNLVNAGDDLFSALLPYSKSAQDLNAQAILKDQEIRLQQQQQAYMAQQQALQAQNQFLYNMQMYGTPNPPNPMMGGMGQFGNIGQMGGYPNQYGAMPSQPTNTSGLLSGLFNQGNGLNQQLMAYLASSMQQLSGIKDQISDLKNDPTTSNSTNSNNTTSNTSNSNSNSTTNDSSALSALTSLLTALDSGQDSADSLASLIGLLDKAVNGDSSPPQVTDTNTQNTNSNTTQQNTNTQPNNTQQDAFTTEQLNSLVAALSGVGMAVTLEQLQALIDNPGTSDNTQTNTNTQTDNTSNQNTNTNTNTNTQTDAQPPAPAAPAPAQTTAKPLSEAPDAVKAVLSGIMTYMGITTLTADNLPTVAMMERKLAVSSSSVFKNRLNGVITSYKNLAEGADNNLDYQVLKQYFDSSTQITKDMLA